MTYPNHLPLTTQGTLRRYTEWGCYPLAYLDRQDSVLCRDCAQESYANPDQLDEFRPRTVFVNYEDPHLYCDNCSERIESAYAEEED